MTVSWVSAEWPARPVTVQLQAILPLWPSTSRMPVGSPTMQPIGLQGSSRSSFSSRRRHALAADLLVIGERKVERARQLRRDHCRDGRQHAGEESLHVAGAAAIDAAVTLGRA